MRYTAYQVADMDSMYLLDPRADLDLRILHMQVLEDRDIPYRAYSN